MMIRGKVNKESRPKRSRKTPTMEKTMAKKVKRKAVAAPKKKKKAKKK